MSARYRYRAEMPREAWNRGREPRERARKRDAYEDLIAGLDRYMRTKELSDLLAPGFAKHHVIQWTLWAAHLGASRSGYVGPAPDMTEWRIVTRWELV